MVDEIHKGICRKKLNGRGFLQLIVGIPKKWNLKEGDEVFIIRTLKSYKEA